MPTFKSPPESDPENEIALLKERLRKLEKELQAQGAALQRATRLFEALSSGVEAQRTDQNQLRGEVARIDVDLHVVGGQVRDIRGSRIWRTLVWIGGLFVRWQKPRALPNDIKEVIPQQPPVPPMNRASASRHQHGAMTIADWETTLRSIANSRAFSPTATPRISIITPVWNTKPAWFAEAAISILEQSCSDWEWCIVDDASTNTEFCALFAVLEETGKVKILRLDANQGISGATNHGLRLASAPYACFLDHDDLLAPTAVEECLEALEQGLDAVYTDSDKVDEAGFRQEPFYKPDWSPEYFRGVMYVGHLLCVRRDLALQAGGFDSHYDRIQDYEFLLRFSEKTQRIGHLTRVLYHWRTVPGSVAASEDAKGDITSLQKAAVQAHLGRIRLLAKAQAGATPHRVRIVPLGRSEHPLVSIVIPTKDAPDILDSCLSSIQKKTTYPNFEVVCVDNETTDPRALEILRAAPVQRVPFPEKFNFSRASNLGARRSRGEYVVFMNNDIEVIGPDWIQEMLYYAEQEDVGAVGGLLLYPDRRVQHAGVVLGCRGTADHVLRHAMPDSDGYAGSLACAREVSAVTAACMMLRRETFERIGGFNEHYFTAYQDVDLCLELRSLGLRNIFCPRAVFIHNECHSRGRYYDHVDRNLLQDRWEEMLAGDPYYNPNFDVQACDYSLKRV